MAIAGSGCTDARLTPAARSTAPTTTLVPKPSTTAASRATVEAEYGCGPTDAAQITIRGRAVGDRTVVLELRWDGRLTDRSVPMMGPRVGAIVHPHLPAEAYEAGRAEVRIVAADDATRVIATTTVDLHLDGGCG